MAALSAATKSLQSYSLFFQTLFTS